MTFNRTFTGAALIVAQLFTVSSLAGNQTTGMRLADKLCARCHAISPGVVGRHPLAPTFADIANRYSVWSLQEAFAEGILVGHASMPKFVLKPNEIDDLLSYMDTMTKPRKRPK